MAALDGSPGSERRGRHIVVIQELVPSYRRPLFSALAAAGERLTVVSAVGGAEEGFEASAADPAQFTHVVLQRRILRLGRCKIVLLRGLLRTVRRLRPDVVVTTGNKSFIQNHLLLAWCLATNRPLLSFQHARTYERRPRVMSTLEALYLRHYVTRFFAGIIVYTTAEREDLLRRGYPVHKIHAAQNTIDTNAIMAVRLGLNEAAIADVLSRHGVQRRPSFAVLGRLVPGKRVALALEYFRYVKARVPDAQLVIIGDGPEAHQLRRAAAGTEGVRFVGQVYDERTIAALLSPCRFVFAAGYAGLAINHSFAHGRPFVTFRLDNHKPEISYLRDGYNGLLLDETNREESTQILVRLLTDGEYFQRMAGHADATARALTIEAMAANWRQAIDQVSLRRQG